MKKPEETFVVVPFAGSGSECVAAKNLGVNFVGFEINPEYVELCKSRLN
jgi:site-specific DNA-methyltransferase (adenine-specific)